MERYTIDDLVNYRPYMYQDYLQHIVFENIIDFVEFYDFLSDSASNHSGDSGLNTLGNVDSVIYASIGGTIDSISLVLKKGRINDAYSLTRKYSDAIIMDIYKSIYLQESFNPEIYFKENLAIEDLIVSKINNWVYGREKLPEYYPMLKKIRESKKAEKLHIFFDFDNRYKEIRSRCNDYNHYNSINHFSDNDNQAYNTSRVTQLSQLSEYLREFFTLHFSYCFSLHPEYMSSSDYVDCMDMGITPDEGSQYWVAPIVQNIFDKYIVPNKPDLAKFIKDNCQMDLK